MKSVNEYTFFRFNDLAIPVVLFLLLMNFQGQTKETSESRVEVHTGEGIQLYKLEADSIFTVMGNLGEMEISIDNERTRITRSPCPGQDCVRQSWLSNPGDIAVCVPSGVFIVIAGDTLSPDAVSY